MSDSAGSAIAINSYDEYGIPASTNVGRFQYTGQTWLPELGMYYYKARIYSPTLGRFMQTDPIGYGDGMNMYAYVGNDPVNFTDPTGMRSCKDSDGIEIICVDGERNDDCETFVCGPSGAIRIRFPGFTFAPPGSEGGGGGGGGEDAPPRHVDCVTLGNLTQRGVLQDRMNEIRDKTNETRLAHSVFGGYDANGQLFITPVYQGNSRDTGPWTYTLGRNALAKKGASISFMIHSHPSGNYRLSPGDKSWTRNSINPITMATTNNAGQIDCVEARR